VGVAGAEVEDGGGDVGGGGDVVDGEGVNGIVSVSVTMAGLAFCSSQCTVSSSDWPSSRAMEDPRSAQRRHPDPATPPVDLGVAVLVRAPLGREHLLPQLPGLRHHLQLLLLASILLLLMLPGAAQDGRFADIEEQRRLDLGILQLRLLLLLRHLE